MKFNAETQRAGEAQRFGISGFVILCVKAPSSLMRLLRS